VAVKTARRSTRSTRLRMATGTARRAVGLVLVLAALVSLAVAPTARGTEGSGPLVQVIVREAPGDGAAPERLVAALGGTVGRRMSIIDGFTAEVPAGELRRLDAGAGVRSVSRDQRVTMAATTYDPAPTGARCATWPRPPGQARRCGPPATPARAWTLP
jgi:hypothetical protein